LIGILIDACPVITSWAVVCQKVSS